MVHPIRRSIVALAAASCALHATPTLAANDGGAPSMLNGLEWRLIGPFRSGWSTMAAGVADQPDTYYSGYAGGGVWKTIDSGQTWLPIFDSQPVSAVSALAVAPSDPRVIYVGTGQIEERYDMGTGSGVYRSSDGGQSWRAAGLADTRHIGAMYVDPRNADVVLVAAVGHLYGSNEQRGMFRSSDGGQSWSRTLYIDSDTGAVDIAGDPNDPDHIYASTWKDRHWPWLSYFMPSMSPTGGIHESHDNGKTWTRVAGKGLPEGDIGRIGLAVGHTAAGTRVYASVTAKRGSGLYRSDDGGANWIRINEARSVVSSYFSRMTLDPRDADTIYLTGQSIKKSTDGGKTFTVVRGSPGGDDYHYLWINPKHPERMITASDQGSVVSVTGGATWSGWYNVPTGQFYYLATDNAFPYRIYSGQQDSGTVG
ncbi:MAG TPA: hypothetical protein VGN77_06945, partial [Steroidobacteraceae bacterium]|nr:hypothetical protein [Steroidobacteraceae bacterium]